MDMSPPTGSSPSDALALRYGSEAAPAPGPWNDTIALMLAHRSVRAYRSDPLPDGTLETLAAAAQSAATSSNLQVCSIVAVTDTAKKAELARLANNQKHIEQCPLFLVWVADLSRNERLAAQEGATFETLPYLETFLVAAIDAALAAQNATLAAESVGLSTVYIGALRNHPVDVGALLALPPGAMAVFGLCVGYAAHGVTNEVKPRLPQSVVLHRESYDAAPEAKGRSAYDALMAGFSQRNEMAVDTWTRRVIGRMGKIAAMSGRHQLTAILHSMGFGLK